MNWTNERKMKGKIRKNTESDLQKKKEKKIHGNNR